MRRLLFGGETEYALSMAEQDRRMSADARATNSRRLMRIARERYPNLPGLGSSGLFLQNGGRFYIDTGEHPEYCTPEVTDPWTLVRHQKAGDALVATLASECGAAVFKNNVDYGGTGATWGSHESYLHRADRGALTALLVPHLVSRIIYTGAGGFDPHAPGVEFSLSPRTLFIKTVTSDRTTSDRGILNSRDEPLSDDDHHQRLHLVCGESLQSELAGVLRFGTTAIVLAMIEAGALGGRIPQLARPVAALRAYAIDPTIKVVADRAPCGNVSALELQRHYLSAAESFLTAGFLPDWAGRLCALWRDILDGLAENPASMKDRLDWAIKLDLYQDHASRRGIEWQSFGEWNTIARTLHKALGKDAKLLHPDRIDTLFGERSSIREQVVELQRQAAARGLKWNDLRTVLHVRQELFELDTRFSQLPHGVFTRLDAAGILQHHVAGIERIDEALTCPPPGRPEVRGRLIAELHAKHASAAAEWDGVYRLDHHQQIDLGDPFIEAPGPWKPFLGDDLDLAGRALHEIAPEESLVSQVWVEYRSGSVDTAFEIAEELRGQDRHLNAAQRSEITRLSAWLRGRLGRTDGARLLDALFADQPLSLGMCSDYLQVFRYNALAPMPAMEPWIEKGRALLAAGHHAPQGVDVVFKEYWACYLSAQGRHQEAAALLHEAYNQEILGLNDQRIRARILCDWAEVNRRLGNVDRAREQLGEAQDAQVAGGYEGDLANFNIPCRAKLERPLMDTTHGLRRANSMLRRLGDRLGRVRVLLLLARLSENRLSAARCRISVIRLKSRLPSLDHCPLFLKIMERWPAWAGDPAPDESGDAFWGL